MCFLSIYTVRKQCFFTVRVQRCMTDTLLQLHYSLSSSRNAGEKYKYYHDINTPPGHHLLLCTCSGYRRQLIICHQPSVSLHQVWKKQCLCVCNCIIIELWLWDTTLDSDPLQVNADMCSLLLFQLSQMCCH